MASAAQQPESQGQRQGRGGGYSYNLMVMVGRLTRDPELRYTPNGAAVAHFALAVDRRYTNQAGERQTDFIDVECWQKLAESASQYLTRGRLVLVQGELHLDNYQTQDGQARRSVRVRASTWQFMEPQRERGPEGAEPAAAVAGAGRARRERPAPGDEATPFTGDDEAASEEDVPF